MNEIKNYKITRPAWPCTFVNRSIRVVTSGMKKPWTGIVIVTSIVSVEWFPVMVQIVSLAQFDCNVVLDASRGPQRWAHAIELECDCSFLFSICCWSFFFFAAPYSAGIFERARYLTMCFVQGYKSRWKLEVSLRSLISRHLFSLLRLYSLFFFPFLLGQSIQILAVVLENKNGHHDMPRNGNPNSIMKVVRTLRSVSHARSQLILGIFRLSSRWTLSQPFHFF